MNPPSGSSSPAFLLVGTENYRGYARFLAESVRRFHPDWTIFFCCVDAGAPVPAGEPFHDLEADWLHGAEGRLARFQYNAVELCGMARSRAILKLFSMGWTRVIYFDMDFSIHGPLTMFADALEKSTMAFTPHLLSPSTKRNPEQEECYYRLTGLVNSGCMAFRDHPETRRFLEWWAERTRRHGHCDISNGVFQDQSWCDYALSFCEGASLLRHPGVNVAWWNLSERPLTQAPDKSFRAGDHPLVCFHWSGFRIENPGVLNPHRPDLPIQHGSTLGALARDYVSALMHHGAGAAAEHPYPYNHLSDGTPIKPAWREAVRRRQEKLSIPADPFEAAPAWINQLKALENDMRFARRDWMLDYAQEQRETHAREQGANGNISRRWPLRNILRWRKKRHSRRKQNPGN